MISELVNRSAQASATTEAFYMHVPANKTGLVIGKGGDTIKQVILIFNYSLYTIKPLDLWRNWSAC